MSTECLFGLECSLYGSSHLILKTFFEIGIMIPEGRLREIELPSLTLEQVGFKPKSVWGQKSSLSHTLMFVRSYLLLACNWSPTLFQFCRKHERIIQPVFFLLRKPNAKLLFTYKEALHSKLSLSLVEFLSWFPTIGPLDFKWNINLFKRFCPGWHLQASRFNCSIILT